MESQVNPSKTSYITSEPPKKSHLFLWIAIFPEFSWWLRHSGWFLNDCDPTWNSLIWRMENEGNHGEYLICWVTLVCWTYLCYSNFWINVICLPSLAEFGEEASPHLQGYGIKTVWISFQLHWLDGFYFQFHEDSLIVSEFSVASVYVSIGVEDLTINRPNYWLLGWSPPWALESPRHCGKKTTKRSSKTNRPKQSAYFDIAYVCYSNYILLYIIILYYIIRYLKILYYIACLICLYYIPFYYAILYCIALYCIIILYIIILYFIILHILQ